MSKLKYGLVLGILCTSMEGGGDRVFNYYMLYEFRSVDWCLRVGLILVKRGLWIE